MQLVERFKQITSARRDAVAVVRGNQHSTYADIGQLAANVSTYLQRHGLSPGDRAALLAANSSEYVAVFYGIWAAGGVTVALNSQAKARDIVQWLKHSDARWLFIDADHPEISQVAEMLDTEIHIIRMSENSDSAKSPPDASWLEISKACDSFPELDISADDLASIIYTSGTTGHPKGVTLSHGNITANIDSILAYLELNESDSIVNVLPFYYSYGNSVLHSHLAVGAKLILENSLLYPHKVIERMSQTQATGFSGVPSTFSLILSRVKLENYDLSSLRYLTQAGGPMPPSMTDKLVEAIPNAKLFVMYGQTEASARLSYLPSSLVQTKRGSIGIPIPGVTLEIRNKSGAICPPGETGEICAKGPNIMQYYWKDEGKTSEVIIDGWLHTGDLAHYDSEGYIYIDGRSSEMIKSGGNRISPKEVEEVIQELDGIQEVAVIGVSDQHLGESIKAYVVTSPDATIDMKAIQRHCKINLAIYKIPKTIEFIEALPKTASGKIQRHLLMGQESHHVG